MRGTQVSTPNTLTAAPPRPRTLVDQVIVILAGVGALALSARLNLPIGPVPITAQTLTVLLVGALLGSRRGVITVLTYLAVGSASPALFFANPAGLAGATGGYLLGFAVSACITGALFERAWGSNRGLTLLGLLLGEVPIFALGLVWLSFFPLPKGLLMAGLVPFLPGEVVKITAAAVVLSRLKR